VSKVMSVSSPLTSGGALGLAEREARTDRKVSRRVWIWKVPGVSAVATRLKVSSGVMASELAVRRPILSQERYLGAVVSGLAVGVGVVMEGYVLSVVTLETEVLCAHDLVCDPDLAHVVGLGGGGVGVDDVLDGQGKDLASRVAGKGGGGLAREDDHDGAGDVGHGIGRDPAVVLVVVGIVVGLRSLELPLRVIVILSCACTLGGIGALPLLGLLVALKAQWLYHAGLLCLKRAMGCRMQCASTKYP
jgi:hypothetical protein